MTVEHVEVLVEELSAEAALREVLERVLADISFKVYPHVCKEELLIRLPNRLAGYAARRSKDPWFRDHCRVVILVDRDDDDCIKLKRRLEKMARDAGLVTRRSSRKTSYAVVTRLAIEELEAWYFGDWNAVRTAYPKLNASVPSQAKYRYPDAIAGGTWEAFERLLQRAGYFRTGLRKIEAARAIAQHMDPARNASPSFRAFRAALEEIATE